MSPSTPGQNTITSRSKKKKKRKKKKPCKQMHYYLIWNFYMVFWTPWCWALGEARHPTARVLHDISHGFRVPTAQSSSAPAAEPRGFSSCKGNIKLWTEQRQSLNAKLMILNSSTSKYCIHLYLFV